MRRWPTPLIALLSLGAARAATLALPAGEPREAWVGPLAEAGIHLAAPGQPSDWTVQVSGDRWVLRSGQTVTAVRAPRDAEARVDLALLLSSLDRPVAGLGWELVGPALPPPPKKVTPPVTPPVVSSPSPAPRPAPPPRATRPQIPVPPAPVVVELPPAPEPAPPPAPPPPAPVVVELPPAPVVVELPEPAPPELAPPEPDPAVHGWLEAGAMGLRRAELGPAVGPVVGAGLGRGAMRAGARAQILGEADLEALGEGRAVSATVGQAGLWWSPRPLGALGAGGALARRVYAQSGVDVEVELSPALWLEGRLEPQVGQGVRLCASVALARDLRETQLWVGEERWGELAAWSVSAGFSLLGATGDQLFAERPRSP